MKAREKKQRKIVTREPRNEETPLEALFPAQTPIELFYVRNHFPIPDYQAERWQLQVEGLKGGPKAYSLSEIQGLPQRSLHVGLECAGNARDQVHPSPPGTPWGIGAVSFGTFTGTPLRNLLPEPQIPGDAIEVAFIGADSGEVRPGERVPYARGLDLSAAMHPDTLLAWAMNGEPLPPAHGAPLRLVVPNWYGMASVKWLATIRILTLPFQGFFQNEHYVYYPDGTDSSPRPVTLQKVRSLILNPADGSTVGMDPLTLEGISWSGAGPVESIKIQVGEGSPWLPAELEPRRSPYAPQRWSYGWRPEISGEFSISVRAKDVAGNQQPLNPVWNRLGYGNNAVHTIEISVAE